MNRMVRVPNTLITRPRLLRKLEAGHAVTILRAPWGFGKTTLVSQWLMGRGDGAVAWVQAASDAHEFWDSVRGAFTEAGGSSTVLTSSRSALVQVRRAVRSAGQRFVLVVDAFERVTDDEVERDLLDLVRDCPELRLIICLRGHHQLGPRACLDLDTATVTAAELRLTVEETAAVLAKARLGHRHDIVKVVHSACGGWPELTSAVVHRLTGSVRRGFDVPSLATDLVRGLLLPELHDDRQRDFALATSILESVPLELAELMAVGYPAKPELELLEAEGMLFVTTEDGEPTYHWPVAARHALTAELDRRSPNRARQLHLEACQWYRDHQRPGPTLRHAIKARNWAVAVDVIDSNWRELLAHHGEVLDTAFAALPVSAVRTSLRTLATRDIHLNAPDEAVLTAFGPSSNVTDKPSRLSRDDQTADVLDTGLALLLALRRRGLFERARAYGDQLVTIAATIRDVPDPTVADHIPGLLVQTGITRLFCGDLPGALDLLRQAYRHHDHGHRRSAASTIALAHAIAGDTAMASSWLELFESAPRPEGWLRELTETSGAIARALVALDHLDLDTACLCMDGLAGTSDHELRAFVAYAHARCSLQAGDALGGLRQLQQVRVDRHAWLASGPAAGPLLAAAEADLLLALGRGNRAHAVLHHADATHPLVQVSRARLRLLAGHMNAARRIADDTLATSTVSPATRLDMLLIRAVSCYRLGDSYRAAKALNRALNVARPLLIWRPFTALPRIELKAIAEHLPSGAPVFNEPALAGAADVFPGHIELLELTERERIVLEHMGAGMSNHEIAGLLHLSHHTVKSHARTLYRKLAAGTRERAIANARKAGLLP